MDWWWQDQPLHIFQFPQAIQDDAIYFVLRQLLGNTYFGTVKLHDGVAEVVSDSCFTHGIKFFRSKSALYLQMNNTPRLYRIKDETEQSGWNKQ